MRIAIAAVGRMKAGPDRALFERFAERAAKSGPKLGLTFTFREFPESTAGDSPTRKAREAEALLKAIPPGATLVALDEGGRALDSRSFAERLAKWRDSGREDVVFVIGGADGLGPAILDKAELRLAFGPMTWPHQLVRVMLAEQLYRAITILAGHPYHRD